MFTKSDLVKGVELHRSLQSAMELMNNRRFSGTCVPYLHVLSSATGDGVQPLQLSIAEIHSAPWSR